MRMYRSLCSCLKCCSTIRHCTMKELMGESPAHIPKGLWAPVKGRSVYSASWRWLCARCVQQVCGSAERERRLRSDRAVFVLLREAIQQPHRARILLQPRAEWRARCVPRPNQTLLPSCVPGPFLPFPLPPPRPREAAPRAPRLSARSQWGPARPTVSFLSFNLAPDSTCLIFPTFFATHRHKNVKKQNEMLWFFSSDCRTNKQRKHWLLSFALVC